MIKKFLICGLGNPGAAYYNTRHNIGRNFVTWFQIQNQASGWQLKKKNFAQISVLETRDKKIVFALPLILMNEAGKMVKQLVKHYQIPLQRIIIVHDDNDIDLGNFKLHFDRGSAGHKGIESIIKHLHSKKFYRLRIGIQPNKKQRTKAEKLVLKKFSLDERKVIANNFIPMKQTLDEKILA